MFPIIQRAGITAILTDAAPRALQGVDVLLQSGAVHDALEQGKYGDDEQNSYEYAAPQRRRVQEEAIAHGNRDPQKP